MKAARPNERNTNIAEVLLDTIFPGFVERNATHAGEHVDAVRRQPELGDHVGSYEVGFADVQRDKRRAKGRQRGPHPLRIVR